MRDLAAHAVVAWRELRLVSALALGLGLLVVGALLLDPEPATLNWPIGMGGPVHWPVLLAALWGGVVVAGGSKDERAQLLARPVGRLLSVGLRAVMLLALIVGAGLVLLWAAELLGVSTSVVGLPTLVFLAAMVLCGAWAGCMVEETPQGLGLALVLGMEVLLLPTILVETFSNSYRRVVVGLGASTMWWLYLLSVVVVFAPGVWRHWSRWAPLRTRRSALRLGVWCGGGLVVVLLLVWLPALLVASDPRRGELVGVFGQTTDGGLLVARGHIDPETSQGSDPDALLLESGEMSVPIAAFSWFYKLGFLGNWRLGPDGLGRHDWWGPGTVLPSPNRDALAVSANRGLTTDESFGLERRLELMRGGTRLGVVHLGREKDFLEHRSALPSLGAWSGDGKRFAQIVRRPDGRYALLVMRVEPGLPPLLEVMLHYDQARIVGWLGDAVLVAKNLGWRGSEPVPFLLVFQDGRMEECERAGNLGHWFAAVSPDGESVAWVDAWGSRGSETPPARVLRLYDAPVRSTRQYELPAGSGWRLLAWLDTQHLALAGRSADGAAGVLLVRSIDGSPAGRVPVPSRDFTAQEIQGPVDGPWLLVPRELTSIVAMLPDGTELWRHAVLPKDCHLNRCQLVTTDTEVLGVGPDGKLWREPLPWLQESGS